MQENSNIKKVKISLVGASGKMGQMVTRLAALDPEIELGEKGEVLIDFSSPEGTEKAIAQKKPLVCGTTGLSREQLKKLEQLAKQVPVLYASNFSLGMALCFEMIQKMEGALKKFCTIAIEETHHLHKRDAPSGTALTLKEILGVEKVTSKRLGEVVGIHQISFSLPNETLVLKHEAFSREAFASGALIAAKFIFNKPPKLYSLRDILFDF